LIVTTRSWGVLALAAVLFVYAFPMQGRGSPQTSHYALVKSLARGTPVIDETRFETGDVPTADYAFERGHYYSNKAPGLALVVLPAYLVLERAGMRTQGDPTNVLWVLGLVGVVLPTLVLLLLVRRLGDEVAPGYGTAAAVALGLGTLLLPYGTMLFAHSLSALCAFAAFLVLWRERRGPPRRLLVGLAGVLAGLAVVVEYPLALCGAVLGVYAAARSQFVSRAVAYAGGVVLGIAPLLLYQQWAFGSPFHASYSNAILESGPSGHERVAGGLAPFFDAPTLPNVVSLLFSQWGLVTLCPVVVAGGVGLIELYKRGLRAEAITCVGIVVAYLVYLAGLFNAWGLGQAPPGPRYLISTLPFLGFPLALAFARAPLPTAALALASVAVMVAVTMTRPLAAWDGHVVDRLLSPDLDGYSSTIMTLVGVTGWYDVLPFFAAVLGAVVFAVLATPRPKADRRALASLLVALAAWILVALTAAEFVDRRLLGAAGAVGVLLFAAAAAFAVVWIDRRPRLATGP
jgi:hypothetical protein